MTREDRLLIALQAGKALAAITEGGVLVGMVAAAGHDIPNSQELQELIGAGNPVDKLMTAINCKDFEEAVQFAPQAVINAEDLLHRARALFNEVFP